MDAIEIESVATPALDKPVFIERLPGVGLVGKLAIGHLVEELNSQPVRRVYSAHLPPAVSVDEEAMETLVSFMIYAIETAERDLLVLAGERQPQDTVGQYRLTNAVLDIATEFDVDEITTLGGSDREEIEEYPIVRAIAAGNDGLKQRLENADVRFQRGEDAPGNVVGMSSLLVGMGARRGFETAGLLGYKL